jgi:leader peptidase (prepilin peptidase) / N-methyltransferase
MLAVLTVFCALLGLAVGSFLNVVIYRVPNGLSIVRPRSACPNCKTQIEDRDNIPVVSWLLLRGRCRTCGTPISKRYPIVEAATGLLFAGVALRFGYSWALPAYLVFAAGLFALAAIDLDVHLLPKKIVYPLLAILATLLVVASAATSDWRALWVGALCSCSWFALFFAINLVSARMLGFGDVRLALVLGLGLGWLGVSEVVIGFFVANLIGAVVGLVLIATHRATRETAVPYGVFLALGAGFAVYTGNVWQLHWHFGSG